MVGMSPRRSGLWPNASRGRAAVPWGGRDPRLGNQETDYWTTVIKGRSLQRAGKGKKPSTSGKAEGTSEKSVPWSQDWEIWAMLKTSSCGKPLCRYQCLRGLSSVTNATHRDSLD